jgi:tetratricopeptide (TPR) repeat protein
MEYTILTAETGDAGWLGVGAIITARLGWAFRPQQNRDVGIDAQVETVLAGHATGRLLGLQIKAGKSWFDEPAPEGDGWVFRETTQRHREYWLRYQLPVLVVLYDVDAHVAYWEHVTEHTAVVTGKGFKIVVPASQRLDVTARPALAAHARTGPTDAFSNLLKQLPAQCAARLRDIDEHDPVGARLLAGRMVAGRATAAESVQQILDGAPADWSWVTWAAIGDYAGQYGQARAAADCFVRAGQAQPDDQGGRWWAFAGLALVPEDPQQALALLQTAASLPGGQLLASIGLAFIEHGPRPGPVPIPAAVAGAGEHAESEPTVQRFLANQAARSGDFAAAIRHHENALRLAPESIGQQLALAEALLQGDSGHATVGRMADYRRAANLASAARAETRRCLLDSRPAAALLMHALTMAGDDEAAARVAIAAPAGEATPQEAADPALAFPAARTAYESGDLRRARQFAAVVKASRDPVWTTQLDAVVAENEGLGADELETRWRAVVVAQVNPGQRLWALSKLAQLGCWPLAELDTLAADGLLTPGMYEMLQAQALAAQGNQQRALALLRQHLAKTILVAEAYARMLNELGRVDESVAACDQASQRFGETRSDLLAMDVLTRAGRVDETLARAKEFLTRADLPLHLRHHVRAVAFDTYYGRQDWTSCERLMTSALGEIIRLQDDLRAGRLDPLILPASAGQDLSDYRRGYAWRLVVTQYNQGDIDRAIATFDAHRPNITSPGEASTWVDLQRLRGWTPPTAAQALQLAADPDLPPNLVGRILLSLLQSIPATPGEGPQQSPADGPPPVEDTHPRGDWSPELRDQLRTQWAAFVQTHHPAASGKQPDDAEQLVAGLPHAQQHRPAEEAIAVNAVWQGRAPLGAVSTAAGQPYLLTIAQQRARILPAVTPEPDIYLSERDAALSALGSSIAIETSALYLCAAVLDLWATVSAEFSEVLIAESAAHDILNSLIASRAVATAAGYLGNDHITSRPHANPIPDTHTTGIIQKTTAVHNATQACRVVAVANLDAIRSHDPIAAVGAYLAPLAAAVEHNVALYSDDAALRAAARSRGIRCFGTLALLDALSAHQERPAEPDSVLRTLFHHNVVDLFQADSLVLDILAKQSPIPEAVLINLARSAIWQPHNAAAADFIATVLSLAHRADPDAIAQVITAAATGSTAAYDDPETVLALIATVALTYVLDVSPHSAAMVLPAIQSVGAQYAVDPIAKTQEMLLAVLMDPNDRFRLSTADAEALLATALAGP